MKVENVVTLRVHALAVVDSGMDKTAEVGVTEDILIGMTYKPQISSADN